MTHLSELVAQMIDEQQHNIASMRAIERGSHLGVGRSEGGSADCVVSSPMHETPAESQSFANDHLFLEGLVAAIRDGYDAIARGKVVDAKDMFAEYGLDWETPIASG